MANYVYKLEYSCSFIKGGFVHKDELMFSSMDGALKFLRQGETILNEIDKDKPYLRIVTKSSKGEEFTHYLTKIRVFE